jgi:hypothetical protein
MYSTSWPQASISACTTILARPSPAELFKGEDAVDFVAVRVQSAPGYRGQGPIDKGAEYAVFVGVGLLLVVVVPDLFLKGEFGGGEEGKEGVII